MSPIVIVMALGAATAASPHTPLSGHKPAWAIAVNDRGPTASQLLHLTVHLARSAAQQQAFDDLLAAQYTPGSPSFHRWLTPGQIGERFGASDAELATVTAWLRQQGFTISGVANARNAIHFAGTTELAAKAFGVELREYAVGGKTLRSLDREPTIPAALVPLVIGVTGLVEDDLRPQHHLVAPPTAELKRNFVSPTDFATIYNLGPVSAAGLDGTGRVIGIIGGATVYPADITNFNALFHANVPMPTKIVPPSGTDPGAPCGDPSCATSATWDAQIEATLDVTRSGSIAPHAKLEMIVDSNPTNALEFAIDSFGSGADATILNLSFGTCENGLGALASSTIDMLYQQGAMQGQSIFVSAGDSGAAGCQTQGDPQSASAYKGTSINVLGASSYDTCMGGTEFADASAQSTYWDGSGNAKSYIPEGAWNEGVLAGSNGTEYLQLGGGGGVSAYIAKPSYQSGVGSAGGTKRLVPDLSFTSADYEGYAICAASLQETAENLPPADCAADSNYFFFPVGGTSAAAPDMAGVAALIEQATGSAQGNLNPTLYAIAQMPSNKVFHDVTVASSGVANCDVNTPSLCNNSDPGSDGVSGGTAGYVVGPGYDEATGWGSIDISALVTSWPGAKVAVASLTVDPTALTVLAGQTGTAALTPSGFTGTPTFSCAGLPSDATCSFSGTTLTVAVAAGGATGATSSNGRLWIPVLGVFALVQLRRRRPLRFAAGLAFVALVSCGKSGDSGGQPDASGNSQTTTSTVTITATSGAQSASATLMLTSD